MGPRDQERARLLRQLARDHPGAHPHTLSLLLQVRHGHEITGQRAAQLLKAFPHDDPVRTDIR